MKVALTLDLDLTDYLTGTTVSDEFEASWPVFLNFCRIIPDLKTTWFVRIDGQIEELYGSPDYIFSTHHEKIQWLRDNGHEIGWHFHSYRKYGGKWEQNTDEIDISNEMKKVFSLVKKNQLEILRMGWAYHSNSTLKMANDLGIRLDCSAFPRPRYSWDNVNRDWTQTKQRPYFPSVANYQISGDENLSILELPISSLPISTDTDTDDDVVRYINPTYYHEKFCEAVEGYRGDTLNFVAHPYEFLPNSGRHALMSFDSEVMLQNLTWLKSKGYEFVTISDLVTDYLRPLE